MDNEITGFRGEFHSISNFPIVPVHTLKAWCQFLPLSLTHLSNISSVYEIAPIMGKLALTYLASIIHTDCKSSVQSHSFAFWKVPMDHWRLHPNTLSVHLDICSFWHSIMQLFQNFEGTSIPSSMCTLPSDLAWSSDIRLTIESSILTIWPFQPFIWHHNLIGWSLSTLAAGKTIM